MRESVAIISILRAIVVNSNLAFAGPRNPAQQTTTAMGFFVSLLQATTPSTAAATSSVLETSTLKYFWPCKSTALPEAPFGSCKSNTAIDAPRLRISLTVAAPRPERLPFGQLGFNELVNLLSFHSPSCNDDNFILDIHIDGVVVLIRVGLS